MKKLKDKHLQKCITGSGWTELGGGEEYARRPDEPGRWLRRNEGGLLTLIFAIFLYFFGICNVLLYQFRFLYRQE